MCLKDISNLFKVTYKSGGVVILHSFCVAKGFKDRVGLQQLSLKLSLKEHALLQ